MQTPIADSLILVSTAGMSLKVWRDTGMLEREWALYERLLEHYGRIVVVTYGGSEDEDILRTLPGDQSRMHVEANTSKLPMHEYVDALPPRVLAVLHSSKSVVVKTNQMVGGETAIAIADSLRCAGKQVGLIARGGYLWSRFVTHEQGPDSDAAQVAAARERLVCQAADMVVGTTDDMVEDLAWRYGLNRSQTRVVPNYILGDVAPVEVCDRERGLLLYAGQLVKRKRVDLLIEAVAKLPEETRSRVTLEVIGEGAERKALEELAKQLGAPVVFKPRIPHRELLQRMARCTLYVQASAWEGHPKTVLEAMGTGAPVIVADAPGLGEVVDHGSTGLRVSGDADAFSNAMNELLGDEDWRELLGAAAARAMVMRLGLNAIVPQEIAVHKLALEFGQKKAVAPRLVG